MKLFSFIRPLRKLKEGRLSHEGRNLGLAFLSALTIHVIESPLAKRSTSLVERNNWGVLNLIPLHQSLRNILSLVLLDYTLYLWHVLNHRNKFLWRFHEIHHLDQDLTATTALRFHFGEMALSSLWRVSQIVLIGVRTKSLLLWQRLTFLEILFHHSNLALPISIERKISKIVVTPRIHTIHHSNKRKDLDSNWSSGLILWDWLHGTLNPNLVQAKEVTIGVPEQKDRFHSFLELVWKPFIKGRERDYLPYERKAFSRKELHENEQCQLQENSQNPPSGQTQLPL